MSSNTFSFLYDLLQTLSEAGVRSWLFGGWAEEMWGVIAPRPHNDIDLLYPACDFAVLDQIIETMGSMTEIQGKHFSHKRAVLYHDVMVEWILLEPYATGYVTRFFDDRHTFYWPHKLLTQTHAPDGRLIDIASCDALAAYRQQFEARVHAYQAYLAHQKSV